MSHGHSPWFKRIVRGIGAGAGRTLLPGPLREPVKRWLSGFAPVRPAILGLNRLYLDDVFVVSYPKSGNTWIWFLVGNLLNPGETITFRNADQHVPDLHKSPQTVGSVARPRFVKCR